MWILYAIGIGLIILSLPSLLYSARWVLAWCAGILFMGLLIPGSYWAAEFIFSAPERKIEDYASVIYMILMGLFLLTALIITNKRKPSQ